MSAWDRASNVPLDISEDVAFGFAEEAGDKSWRVYLAVGLLFSITLHGLILLAFHSAHDPVFTSPDIPMDIVLLSDETTSPPQPVTAPAPQQQAGIPSSPAAEPLVDAPARQYRDALEMKLRALAKLRLPTVDTHVSRNVGLSRLSATSNNATAGEYAAYAVTDFIRAQVERRWGLNLAALGKGNFSILIHVKITSAGVVTKAEIVDIARFHADKTYREIALSARNAVLLSSPFALPPGHYSTVMDLIVSLNTREVLR